MSTRDQGHQKKAVFTWLLWVEGEEDLKQQSKFLQMFASCLRKTSSSPANNSPKPQWCIGKCRRSFWSSSPVRWVRNRGRSDDVRAHLFLRFLGWLCRMSSFIVEAVCLGWFYFVIFQAKHFKFLWVLSLWILLVMALPLMTTEKNSLWRMFRCEIRMQRMLKQGICWPLSLFTFHDTQRLIALIIFIFTNWLYRYTDW